MQRSLLGLARNEVAGVRDEKVGGIDALDITVITGNRGSNILVFGQQFQEFKTSKIDVMKVSSCNQVSLNRGF